MRRTRYPHFLPDPLVLLGRLKTTEVLKRVDPFVATLGERNRISVITDGCHRGNRDRLNLGRRQNIQRRGRLRRLAVFFSASGTGAMSQQLLGLKLLTEAVRPLNREMAILRPLERSGNE